MASRPERLLDIGALPVMLDKYKREKQGLLDKLIDMGFPERRLNAMTLIQLRELWEENGKSGA